MLKEKIQQLIKNNSENSREIQQIYNKTLRLQEELIDTSPSTSFNLDLDRIKLLELQAENQTLAALLKQYESAIEIIMSKFRLQTEMLNQNRLDMMLELEDKLLIERTEVDRLRAENVHLSTLLENSTSAIRSALAAEEDLQIESIVHQLEQENTALKEVMFRTT